MMCRCRCRQVAEDAPASSVAGSVAVVNDYLFRGLSQTNWKPAIQPGIEYDHASGWYVGGWGSNISWLSDASSHGATISSSVELDFYTGYRGSFGGDWSYDVGLYEYYYPGTYPRGFTRPYTTEGYASLGFKGITLKYSHAFTNLFGFADSKHSGYVDLSYSYEFSPGWTAGCARRPPEGEERRRRVLQRLEGERGQGVRPRLFGLARLLRHQRLARASTPTPTTILSDAPPGSSR